MTTPTTSRVSDEMVEAAAKRFMQIRGLGMHAAWESMTEESRIDYRKAFRGALEAAQLLARGSHRVKITESEIQNALDIFYSSDLNGSQYPPSDHSSMRAALEATLTRQGDVVPVSDGDVAHFVEETAKILSGSPFPSARSYAKARQIADLSAILNRGGK